MIIDFRIVCRQLGLLFMVLSMVILAMGVFSAVEHATGLYPADGEVLALVLTAGGGVLLGGVLMVIGRSSRRQLGHREALLLVAMSWILGAALAAAPYRLWASLRTDAATEPHAFDRYVDCYFEAMSGLTTTGATVVTSLSTLPRGILLWRSTTHWLGGLGIVVLFVAVLPMLGVGGRRVFKIEAPGPTPDGVTPRIQDTARMLWLIYMGLTVMEIVLLRVGGMGWFDSVNHTFATLATGGFSTYDNSVAAFESSFIHAVIIFFMLLAGVNFGLYYQLIQRNIRDVWRDPELRLYLGIIFTATVVVSLSLWRSPPAAYASTDSVPLVVRDALFQVVSIQTTTGFCSADFDQWGFAAKATLCALMFVGGSAGSTGGGIKVVRILIAAKVLLAELEHVYRRNVVRPMKVGRAAIDADLRISTLVYVLGILGLFLAGAVILRLVEGVDFTSCATAAAATLNNIGPGLGKVGATQNYAWFTPVGKVVLSTLMLLGRLELFAILVLFSPRFWRGE